MQTQKNPKSDIGSSGFEKKYEKSRKTPPKVCSF